MIRLSEALADKKNAIVKKPEFHKKTSDLAALIRIINVLS